MMKLAILMSFLFMGCGLTPLKPLTPLGCKDLVPVCVCDANGDNCVYQWVCVK